MRNGEDAFPTRLELARASRLCLWLLGIPAMTVVAGQLVALPTFMALHLLLAGRYSWRKALLGAVAAWTLIYVLFDRIIAVVWYPSLLLN